MKKIVIDARELHSSTGRYVEMLVENLQDVDTDLSHRYVVLLSPKDMDSWEPRSKRFTKVACRYKDFSLGEQLGFAWQLYRLNADLVHFRLTQQPILYQRAVVTTIQDLTTLRFPNPSKNALVFKFKQWIYRWVLIIAAKKSRALITPTEWVKDDVAKYTNTNSRKITVTYESGEHYTDEKPEPLEEAEGKKFILYIGRPTPHKNIPRLIDAFALLQAKHPDLYFVLGGKTDSNYRRIKRDAEKQGVTNLIFPGFVSDGQAVWLHQHCEAYVFGSLSEGFSITGVEAMLSGAPVVSSNASCLPEVQGNAAHYFDPDDTEDIARAINDVLTKPDLRKKLIRLGHEQAKKYSWKRMAEQTLEVYKAALKEN